jgi:hypothetical protein
VDRLISVKKLVGLIYCNCINNTMNLLPPCFYIRLGREFIYTINSPKHSWKQSCMKTSVVITFDFYKVYFVIL